MTLRGIINQGTKALRMQIAEHGEVGRQKEQGKQQPGLAEPSIGGDGKGGNGEAFDTLQQDDIGKTIAAGGRGGGVGHEVLLNPGGYRHVRRPVEFDNFRGLPFSFA